MGYDPDKHQRRSLRLPDYDYALTGAYFITICVHQRQCLFGEIMGGVMRGMNLAKLRDRTGRNYRDIIPTRN